MLLDGIQTPNVLSVLEGKTSREEVSQCGPKRCGQCVCVCVGGGSFLASKQITECIVK